MSLERPLPLFAADAKYVYAGTVPLRDRAREPVEVEQRILAEMVRAGWTRDAAWTTVRASHPKGFTNLCRVPEDFPRHWRDAGGAEPLPREASARAGVSREELAASLGAAVRQMWRRLPPGASAGAAARRAGRLGRAGPVRGIGIVACAGAGAVDPARGVPSPACISLTVIIARPSRGLGLRLCGSGDCSSDGG